MLFRLLRVGICVLVAARPPLNTAIGATTLAGPTDGPTKSKVFALIQEGDPETSLGGTLGAFVSLTIAIPPTRRIVIGYAPQPAGQRPIDISTRGVGLPVRP